IQATHATLAAYAATAFAVAGVYAWGALRGRADRYHRAALALSMALGLVTAVLMPITGHVSAQWVARNQPAKLAAMEAQFVSERQAPLRIGGIPDPQARTVLYAIEIPGGLSWLAFGNRDAWVAGLDGIARSEWPNVLLTHLSFQVMVAAGMVMLAVAVAFWITAWRRRGAFVRSRPLLWALVGAGPLGYVALEAGWVVTEVGRQPWTVYGLLRTSEAVTPAAGLWVTFAGFMALYAILLATLLWLLGRLARAREDAALAPAGEEAADGPG
ncbi:MAG TPA: cytochrome ubiquinol oxidase subunit I, partial [Limnochordia bacterium]